MPQLEGADQIAVGCTATDAERPGELRRSGSATRLNAQAPEFVPRGPPAVVAVVPPPVILVFAAPPPPPQAAFFAAPPPFEYHAPVGGCGRFAAKELKPMPDPLLEPELENPPVVEAEQLVLVEGLPDEVVHKITKQLHAFVEYETAGDAEKAILELNDEKKWRNGLRVRLLNTCTTKGAGKGKKGVPESDGNGEDVSISNQSTEKQFEQSSQLLDVLPEHLFDDNYTDKEVSRRGKGRGRGGRGRGRGYQQYNNNQYHQNNQHYNHHGSNRGGGNHHVGTPPNNRPIKPEQLPIGATKQPPGPRMPDGTRGFTMGRGKPQTILTSLCAVGEA